MLYTIDTEKELRSVQAKVNSDNKVTDSTKIVKSIRQYLDIQECQTFLTFSKCRTNDNSSNALHN